MLWVHTSTPLLPLDHFVQEPVTEIAGESRWQVSRNSPFYRFNSLNFTLLSSHFVDHSQGSQISRWFLPIQGDPSCTSTNHVVINFLIIFLHSPWTRSQLIGHTPWMVKNHTSGYFFSKHRGISKGTAWSSRDTTMTCWKRICIWRKSQEIHMG